MENLRVDLSQAPWIVCECGNELFKPAMMFKKLSSLLSPTGKEELIPVEVVICTECGKIPSFITKNVKDIPEKLKATSERKFIVDTFKDDIDTVGKCANCGIEFHIHKLGEENK